MPALIAFTDSQLDAVVRASQPLAPIDRSKFLEAVADAPRGRVVGDGAVYLAMRMTAEKTAAMLEAQAAAAMALATGSSPRAATRKAVAPYRRRVKANRRRLVRKK
jgi:hypothetical protein